MNTTAASLGEKPPLLVLLEAEFPQAIQASHCQHGDQTVVISTAESLKFFTFLRDDARCRFDLMIDLSAVDYLPRNPRFEMVYHFKSTVLHHRLRVKILVGEEAPAVSSIMDLWVAADWYERECAEMYGIHFEGHPNLEPLLLYKGFEGYPLRKDYEKGRMQPLVPMRAVAERYDYGESFHPVAVTEES